MVCRQAAALCRTSVIMAHSKISADTAVFIPVQSFQHKTSTWWHWNGFFCRISQNRCFIDRETEQLLVSFLIKLLWYYYLNGSAGFFEGKKCLMKVRACLCEYSMVLADMETALQCFQFCFFTVESLKWKDCANLGNCPIAKMWISGICVKPELYRSSFQPFGWRRNHHLCEFRCTL